MAKAYLVVEGHGETRAALNLVTRVWTDRGLPHIVWSDPPIRGKALHTEEGIAEACRLVRSKGDAEALLILRDEDDACPKDTGPQGAAWLSREGLPYPTALVLAHREYETWFLPCVHLMAGKPIQDHLANKRPGLLAGTTFTGKYESIRGVKEWLTRHFPRGRSYKPTVDQLPMTRMIDIGVLRAAGVPSYETFERALAWLSTNRGKKGVYPPPPAQQTKGA